MIRKRPSRVTDGLPVARIFVQIINIRCNNFVLSSTFYVAREETRRTDHTALQVSFQEKTYLFIFCGTGLRETLSTFSEMVN